MQRELLLCDSRCEERINTHSERNIKFNQNHLRKLIQATNIHSNICANKRKSQKIAFNANEKMIATTTRDIK